MEEAFSSMKSGCTTLSEDKKGEPLKISVFLFSLHYTFHKFYLIYDNDELG